MASESLKLWGLSLGELGVGDFFFLAKLMREWLEMFNDVPLSKHREKRWNGCPCGGGTK